MDKMKDFDFNNMKMPDNMDLNSMKDAAEQFGMDPKLLDNINMNDGNQNGFVTHFLICSSIQKTVDKKLDSKLLKIF